MNNSLALQHGHMTSYHASAILNSGGPNAGSLRGAPALGGTPLTGAAPGYGGLNPSPSAGSLRNSGMLGQSVSVSSLMTTGSDAAHVQAPPRSAQSVLGTGEALQSYLHLPQQAELNHPFAAPQRSRGALSRDPSAGSIGAQASHFGGHYHSMGGPPPRGAAFTGHHQAPPLPYQHGHQQQLASSMSGGRLPSMQQAPAPAPSAPTWVIEEVIDFGLPSDEEVDDMQDRLHRMCKPMSVSGYSESQLGFWETCLRPMCADEFHRQDPRSC